MCCKANTFKIRKCNLCMYCKYVHIFIKKDLFIMKVFVTELYQYVVTIFTTSSYIKIRYGW